MLDPLPGTSLPLMDSIALQLGVPPSLPSRTRSALRSALAQECANNGHVYLPWAHLKAVTARLVEASAAALSKEIGGRGRGTGRERAGTSTEHGGGLGEKGAEVGEGKAGGRRSAKGLSEEWWVVPGEAELADAWLELERGGRVGWERCMGGEGSGGFMERGTAGSMMMDDDHCYLQGLLQAEVSGRLGLKSLLAL